MWRLFGFVGAVLVFAHTIVPAAAAQSVGFATCFGVGEYCAEAPLDTVDTFGNGCGRTFWGINGRVSFPYLTNQGPITISLLSYSLAATFPVYVEVRNRATQSVCTTLTAGYLVLVAQGIPSQCGGVWEAVGPIDLTGLGIPLGTDYLVQLVGYRGINPSRSSAAVACVEVRSGATTSVVRDNRWGHVKMLYR